MRFTVWCECNNEVRPYNECALKACEYRMPVVAERAPSARLITARVVTPSAVFGVVLTHGDRGYVVTESAPYLRRDAMGLTARELKSLCDARGWTITRVAGEAS